MDAVYPSYLAFSHICSICFFYCHPPQTVYLGICMMFTCIRISIDIYIYYILIFTRIIISFKYFYSNQIPRCPTSHFTQGLTTHCLCNPCHVWMPLHLQWTWQNMTCPMSWRRSHGSRGPRTIQTHRRIYNIYIYIQNYIVLVFAPELLKAVRLYTSTRWFKMVPGWFVTRYLYLDSLICFIIGLRFDSNLPPQHMYKETEYGFIWGCFCFDFSSVPPWTPMLYAQVAVHIYAICRFGVLYVL